VRCALLPLLDGVAWIVGRWPQPLVLAVGRALAWLGRPLLRKRRRVARINIDLCFPEFDENARRRLVDASVANTVIGVFEMLRAWHAPAKTLAPLATVEGIDRLRDALARGGVVLLGGHLTHSELAMRMIGDALGRKPFALVRRHNDPCLERWIDRSRLRMLAGTVAKKDVRGLLRALQAGEPVAYLSDQNFNYQHAFVPFFGVPAATITALPDIVRRGRATMLPFWSRRDADGRYHVTVGPAWDGWPSDDPERDAARYMAELEAAVRAAPDQYLWVHQRFKTRPPGAPPLYPP
jgi:KDO2-lipid IV(A) lauroyltransferase